MINIQPVKTENFLTTIKLNSSAIIAMHMGFFSIPYSFGFQQTNMVPIYAYLSINANPLPLLNLANPVTSLIIERFIGARSDKNTSKFGTWHLLRSCPWNGLKK